MRDNGDRSADRRQLAARTEASPYDAAYYRNYHTCAGPMAYERSPMWLDFFGGVADTIVRTLKPRRVFDAGCAIGMLVESLRDRGVDARGADISEYAISKVRPDVRPYCVARSITEPFGGRFDLVTCIEVLEHLPEEEAQKAVRRMCASGEAVLFSSTPGDLDEPTHINVHPGEYWIELFSQLGFYADRNYDTAYLSPHAILFRRHVERGRAAWSPDRIAELESETLAMRRRALQAEAQASELKGRLESILESPGWRMVLRYRKWMGAAHWLERPAAWMLRKMVRGRHVALEAAPPSNPKILDSSRAAPKMVVAKPPDWGSLPSAAIVFVSAEPSDRSFGVETVRVEWMDRWQTSVAVQLNAAARITTSDVLVFIDETVEPISDDWLAELTGPLTGQGVGICGAEGGGIEFGPDGEIAHPDAGGCSNRLAVSGACLAIRRDVFERVGGFSIAPAFPRLDIDLCLKARLDAGQHVVMNSAARVRRAGPAAIERWIGADAQDVAKQWIRSNFPEGDPFVDPGISPRESAAAQISPTPAAFDCTLREIRDSIASCERNPGALDRITWFVPDNAADPFVLRMADHLFRARRIHSTFVAVGRAHPSKMRERFTAFSQELANHTIQVVDHPKQLAELEPSDAAIATDWRSAYHLLRYNRAGRKFYVVEDCAERGSARAMVEATWQFGFIGLCRSPGLRDRYIARGGNAALFMEHSADEFLRCILGGGVSGPALQN